MTPAFYSLGDGALVVHLGSKIDLELNRVAVALAHDLSVRPFPGMIEAVPAYSSLTIYYDAQLVEPVDNVRTRFDTVVAEIVERESKLTVNATAKGRLWRIPVCYDGPDLASLSERLELSIDAILQLHSQRIYRVYMMGFLPGFAYMGELDERLAVPRRATPRPRVEAGSVGIAGRQAGIYPMTSPGGWQIIGHTDAKIFDPSSAEPLLFATGDEVQFVPV